MSDALAQPEPIFDSMSHLLEQPLTCSYAIKSDFNHLKQFLLEYRKSSETFNTYRREAERLAQWAWLVAKKSILKLSRTDIEAYLEFCQSPPKSWIGEKRCNRFLLKQGLREANPNWRLFVSKPGSSEYAISEKSLQCLFSSISSLYQFLIAEGITENNPVNQIRQKSQLIRKQSSKRRIRRLGSLQWDFLIETAETMAAEDPALHERTLFIVSSLYLMYLRVSELAADSRYLPTMGDFYQDSDETWWFRTVGKGNKERDISVSDAMLTALRRYRSARELTPPLPLPGEATPLILKLRGNGPITSTRQIREIVQQCFSQAVEKMKHEGFHDESAALAEATVHWLRHTGISDDINKRGRPLAHVRDDAGHASSSTTDIYNDAEHQARHQTARKKKLREGDI